MLEFFVFGFCLLVTIGLVLAAISAISEMGKEPPNLSDEENRRRAIGYMAVKGTGIFDHPGDKPRPWDDINKPPGAM
jgi:hypothetical protein